MNIHDQAHFDGEIPNGESETLEVDTYRGNTQKVVCIVTNPEGDAAPDYDLGIDILPGTVPYSDVTARVKENQNVRYHERTAIPTTMRYTVTNRSGDTDSFRVVLLAVGPPR